jgi:hypothetical protein
MVGIEALYYTLPKKAQPGNEKRIEHFTVENQSEF